MEKRKIYGTIIGILLFLFFMMGLTYAYFYWSSSENDKTKVNLTISKGLENMIVYNCGESILGTDNQSLQAVDKYQDGVSTTIEFWKNNTGSNTTIYGELSLEVLQMLSKTGTIDANIGKSDTIKWAITTYNVNNATEVLVAEGTFNGRTQGDKFSLIQNFVLNDYQTFYKFYLWLDGSSVDYEHPVLNEFLSVEISAAASDEMSHYGENPAQVLAHLGFNTSVSNTTPSFATATTNSDAGIYRSRDDFGISYYFRGNVTNNYVYFAGIYWRIIRINGDGSLRLIYDGKSAYTNGTSNVGRRAGVSEYKTSPYNHNTYIGYMYGSTSGSDFNTTHTNATNSTMKAYLDNWYVTNIVNKGYSLYVVDAVYCNDRSVTSGTGVGTTNTQYTAYNRLETNKTPTLECAQDNDKFTVSTALGNGKLTYPIGLITADEVAMAGGVYGTANSSYYLYTGNYFYTMTPYNFNNNTPNIIGVGAGGALTYSNSYTSYGVRPVISIRASALTTGNGSSTNPFKIS